MKSLFYFTLGVVVSYLTVKHWEAIQKQIPEPIPTWTRQTGDVAAKLYQNRVKPHVDRAFDSAGETYQARVKPYVDKTMHNAAETYQKNVKGYVDQALTQAGQVYQTKVRPHVEQKVIPAINEALDKAQAYANATEPVPETTTEAPSKPTSRGSTKTGSTARSKPAD
jgi:uncharacterized protein (DUF1778 family)